MRRQTYVVKVCYPHEQHGLARKPSNSEKCSVRSSPKSVSLSVLKRILKTTLISRRATHLFVNLIDHKERKVEKDVLNVQHFSGSRMTDQGMQFARIKLTTAIAARNSIRK